MELTAPVPLALRSNLTCPINIIRRALLQHRGSVNIPDYMDSDPPPPYEPPAGSGDDANTDANISDSVNVSVASINDNVNDSINVSTDVSTDVSLGDSFDENAPSINWASDHLQDARSALASYPEATRALKRQVLEELEVIRLGIDHRGPPPAHTGRVIVPPWKDGARTINRVPTSSIFGPGNIEAQLDDAIRHEAFGYNKLMPYPPVRDDPLRDAFEGVRTMAVRNPSAKWGAMVPRQHFPGAEVEGVIPEMKSTPEFVILRRHVCGTQCPEECHEGGGVRKKGKGKAVAEVGDVEGGEAMEGVVFAHWGDDGFDESDESGSEHERQEKLRKKQELETIESLEHCTIIERHRRKWAAEIGALTYKARIMTDKLPSICLNTIEPNHREKIELDEPGFFLAGKMIKRLDEQRDKADELKKEKARLAKIRIAKWRARMVGRDTTQMGDEEGEAVFSSLVDSGGLAAPAYDDDDGAPGPAPRSPEKEDSAIDVRPGPSVVAEKPPMSDSDEAMPLQGSHPTIKSTEAVSDLAQEGGNKSQEIASQEHLPQEIRSLEATSGETAEEESIAQALIAQAAIVRDATTPDPTLEETPILEAATQETTSEEAAPENAVSENPAPGEAAPKDITVERPAPKEATRDTATETAAADETSDQENVSPGPGPSRKRPAPKKSSLKRRPAKRQSIREPPFLDPSEREAPPVWILQRDGRFIRNPLADSQSGPLAGRRWSDPDIDAPVPMPPSDSEPRPRSATVSEGTEPPVPRCSADDALPTIGGEGQITEHVEEAGERWNLPSPPEWALEDRDGMPPPPSPRPRKRSLAVSEGSPYLDRLWSLDDMFPSIERLSQAAGHSSSGGDSAADVTSLAPARASTPEPPQMSREHIRSSARVLADLLGAAEERYGDPDTGLIVMMTNPRMAELAMPHRPIRGPSVLRREFVIDEEVVAAEDSERHAQDVEEIERGPFASRVPNPPRYNLRSRSRSTENQSPVTPSIFSSETSGRSSETTSVTVTPLISDGLAGEAVAAGGAAEGGSRERVVERGDLPSSPSSAVNRQVVSGDSTLGVEGSEANLWREGSLGTEGISGREGGMGREGSLESEESIGRDRSAREESITTEVAETLGGLVVESAGETLEEEGGAEGNGVLGRVLPSTEVADEAIDDEEDGVPLSRVPSHSSTHLL